MKELLGKDRTILLVDDEPDLLSSLQIFLQKEFGKVLTAPGGKEALEIMKIQAVDVIVSDLRMPKMTGADFVGEIKQRYPLVPVILLTGNVEDPGVAVAIQNGAFDVVEKGYGFEILVNRIRNALLQPLLIQVVWSVMSREWAPPKIEDFMRLSFEEQLKALYAFSALIKTKSL